MSIDFIDYGSGPITTSLAKSIERVVDALQMATRTTRCTTHFLRWVGIPILVVVALVVFAIATRRPQITVPTVVGLAVILGTLATHKVLDGSSRTLRSGRRIVSCVIFAGRSDV